MDIIIVGCGNAGTFHRNAYLQLKEEGIFKGNLFFVDIKGYDTNNFNEMKIYKNVEDLLSEHKLEFKNTIVDICLPIASMLFTIQQFKKYEFYNFICEKPFLLYKEKNINAKEVLEDINLYVVANYIYSEVTCSAQAMIKEYNLKAKMVISNFSKDRRMDSLNNRAFNGNNSELSVFEVEVPHQIYICQSLFGKIKRVNYKQCEDMVVEGKSIKNHGRGTVVCTNENGNMYIINSNLQTQKNRSVDAILEEQYSLHLCYSTITTEKFQCNYGVFLYKDKELIDSKIIDKDNNMYEMLKTYYLGFLKKVDKPFETYMKLLDTSELFKEIEEEENSIDLFDLEEGIFSTNTQNNLNENVVKRLGGSICYSQSYLK